MKAERALFSEVAAGEKYDVLVAPVQSDGYAFDRISRSLMTAQLVAALRERGLRVPNPYVVQRVVGEGRREVHGEIELAKRLGVERIVGLAMSHDRDGKLHLSVTLFEKHPGHGGLVRGQPQRLTPVELRDNAHPADLARAAMPEVLRAIGVPAPVRKKAPPSKAPARMPESPTVAIAATTESPVELATSMQLLATLASNSSAERARERLFEQALLAALALPDGHPSAAFFRARAWQNLESRSAALGALGKSVRPEAVAYRQFLNGNLPEFSAALAKVNDPLTRLLLEIDLSGLKQAYELPGAHLVGPELAEMLKPYPEWIPLVTRRLAELDRWYEGDISLPWRLLSRDLPVSGAGMMEFRQGQAAIGRRPDTGATAKGMLSHLQRALREDQAVRQCLHESVLCARSAYLDMLESLLVSHLYHAAYVRGVQQGQPSAALELLRSIEPEFEGQTDALLAKAEVLVRWAYGGAERNRDANFATARSAAEAVAWLEQSASRTAHKAMAVMSAGTPESIPYLEAYFFDLPVRSYWYLNGGNFSIGRSPTRAELGGILRARADAAVTEAEVAFDLITWAKSGGADLGHGDILKSRFGGHPRRAQILASQGAAQQDPAAQAAAAPGGDQLARLEAAIRERPDTWSNYGALARYHKERGDNAAALKAFMAFPGFENPRGYDAVSLSNQAYAAASDFFWRGHLDEARPLFQVAADLGTGSAASISSQARLSLLDGDFGTHARLSHSRAQRYNDPYGYRDYLAWLFAFGLRREGWTGFAQLHGSMQNPQVWLAADVGHRIEGRTWTEVKAWLLSEPFKSSAFNRDKRALRLAIMQSSVDRTPSSDLVEVMRSIAGPPVVKTESSQDGKGALLAPSSRTSGDMFVSRSRFRLSQRPAFKGNERVPSDFVLFADAYLALRRGDHASAVEKFDAMATYYPIEGDPAIGGFDSYALAYFAWVSARSGDTLALESFVRGLNPERLPFDKRFDRSIALAFFAGLRGEHETALGELKRAFDTRPNTERRPVPTEFQWAEACEWLFEATKDRRYIDLALPWARVHQRIQPMMAWAYAFEAKHTKNEQDRIRALGVALYLDPNSERIARFLGSVKSEARQHFERNNPFDPQRQKPGTA